MKNNFIFSGNRVNWVRSIRVTRWVNPKYSGQVIKFMTDLGLDYSFDPIRLTWLPEKIKLFFHGFNNILFINIYLFI